MTDTNTLAPTDAEILDAAEDFRSQYMHGSTTFDEFDEIGFTRAVLVKWGAPAPASSKPAAVPAGMEPVAWRYKYKFRDIGETGAYEYHSHEFASVANMSVGEPLYTAAQVQAMLSHGIAPGWQAVPVQPVPAPGVEAVSEREFKQFLSDVVTAAGLVTHGKKCKDLGRRLGEMSMRLLTAPKTAAAPAQAAPVDAQHSTACLYHYALSRLGLRDNTGLRVLFWDAHNSLSWDSETDWYVTPDANKADCGQCNAARAAQGGA